MGHPTSELSRRLLKVRLAPYDRSNFGSINRVPGNSGALISFLRATAVNTLENLNQLQQNSVPTGLTDGHQQQKQPESNA